MSANHLMINNQLFSHILFSILKVIDNKSGKFFDKLFRILNLENLKMFSFTHDTEKP